MPQVAQTSYNQEQFLEMSHAIFSARASEYVCQLMSHTDYPAVKRLTYTLSTEDDQEATLGTLMRPPRAVPLPRTPSPGNQPRL